MRISLSLPALLMIGLVALPGFAQEADEAPPANADDAAPAAQDAPDPEGGDEAEKAEKVAVVAVEGPAQKLVMEDGEETWVDLKKGDKLDERTIVRTGLRAKVVLHFAKRGEVVVNSASKMGVREFRRKGERVKARVGLKYGTIQTNVRREAGENDFKIATPAATLSIRGTGGDVGYASDVGVGLQATHGTWQVNAARSERFVSAGESTKGRAQLMRNEQLRRMQRDPMIADVTGGMTDKERRNLRNHGRGRGLTSMMQSSGRSPASRTQLTTPAGIIPPGQMRSGPTPPGQSRVKRVPPGQSGRDRSSPGRSGSISPPGLDDNNGSPPGLGDDGPPGLENR